MLTILARALAGHRGAPVPAVKRARAQLRQNFAQDMAVDVGEAALKAVVVEGQPGVIDAEKVQNGRVEIVDRHRMVGAAPQLIGGAVGEATLETRAGKE